MSDHDFKLAEKLKEQRDTARDEIDKLRAELEDVRQQRETLKAECVALTDKLQGVRDRNDEHLQALGALRERFWETKAEVERRGEILKQCSEDILALMSEHPGMEKNWYESIQKRLAKIESLDNAPDSSSQRG